MKDNKENASYYSQLRGFDRIVPIILAAVALFIILCFTSDATGSVGRVISNVLLGLFSRAAYTIPILLLFHALFYPQDRVKHRRLSRLIFSILLLLIVSSLIYVVTNFNREIYFNAAAYYKSGVNRIGGGFIGSTFAFAILKTIGIGGYFILVGAIIAIYTTQIVTKNNVNLTKLFFKALTIIAEKFALWEARAKKARADRKAAEAEKKRRLDDKRRHDLYSDEYFDVDNGMRELSINELGISERRSRSSIEINPNLDDSVHHKSEFDGAADKDSSDADVFFSDDTITISMSDEQVTPKAPSSGNRSESFISRNDTPVSSADEPEARTSGNIGMDARADDVFTKSFDPFDFSLGERLASKPSSKASEIVTSAPDTQPHFSEQSINNITEEDVAKARRLAEFEERKRTLVEQENLRREQENRRREQEILRKEQEILRKEQELKEKAEREAAMAKPASFAPAGARPSYSEAVRTDNGGYAANPEPIKEEPAFKPYTPVQAENPSASKPSATVFNSTLVEEVLEDTPTVIVEPDEDDEPLTVTAQPEDDFVEVIEEPIPVEEQSKVVLEQRRMFSIFDEPDTSATASESAEEEFPDVSVSEFNENDAGPLADGDILEDEDDEPPFDVEPEQTRPTAHKSFNPFKIFGPKKPDYSNYRLPPIELLGVEDHGGEDKSETSENASKLIETLASFNVTASIKGFDRGPRITRYEVVPAKGVKVSSIMNLFDDIALNLAAEGIRMEAPIPGKSAVGVEIPNNKPYTVRLRSLLETEEFSSAKSKTFVCVGKDVAGQPVFGDISKMPHVLIAGATGMGKSVCINSLLLSMLYKARPDEVKFIMIDPKKVEFNMYNGIPHLLIPVVTDPKQAAGALMWAVEQMEKRYDLIEQARVRNIEAYNAKVLENPGMGEPMPKIVIVVDELADLMLQVKNPVEGLIMSIAQKARAAGIHLIIGTQRPSVDIITGVIKANIPTRISCKVMSNADSRTILDIAGAEKLLDKGDMLFNPAGAPKPKRVQGAFVSDSEVESIIEFIKAQATGNVYDDQALEEINRAAQKCSKEKGAGGKGGFDDDGDFSDDGGLYNNQEFLDAVDVAVSSGKISTSLLQRKLSIGFGKAAKFIDSMEDLGIVSGPNGQKPRDVLITKDEWHEKLSRVSLD